MFGCSAAAAAAALARFFFCAPLLLLCTVEALLRIIFDDNDKDKLGGWRQHFFSPPEVGWKKEMQRREVTNDMCAHECEGRQARA